MSELWADGTSRAHLLEKTTLIQAGTSMGSYQSARQELPELTHTLRVKLWRCGITFHTDTLNEQKIPRITFSSVTTSLPSSAAGTLNAVHADPHMCLRWKGSLEALLTPSKQLSRQRIPQIAEQKSDDCMYYQPSFGTTISRHCVIHATWIAKKKPAKRAPHDRHLILKHTRIKYIFKK